MNASALCRPSADVAQRSDTPRWHLAADVSARRPKSDGRDWPAPAVDGAASSLRHDFSSTTVFSNGLRLQTKLRVGSADDRYEREADAMADAVMRSPVCPSGADEMAAPCALCNASNTASETLQRQPSSPFSIGEGVIEEEEEETPGADKLQAKPAAGGSRVAAGVARRVQALRSGGAPLPATVRSFMEPRFGHDFAKVRVHTGSMANDTAARINARAYTIGRDVVFGSGQFSPGSDAGRRLIAHELTHVVQQGHAVRRAHGTPSRRPDPAPGTVARDTDGDVIRRVVWFPNKATRKVSHPWGTGGPAGKIFKAATDAGTPLDIWRPNNGKTYWCHGYTFGGSTARGGPYSIWGSDVPTVLKDDGWQQTYSCMAQPADVLVFWDDKGKLTHSGIIRRVSAPGGRVDDTASTLESKWGAGSHNTTTWETNAKNYGKYLCYSKAPFTGVCSGKGANEI